jgi:hypothetical protein
VIYETEGGNRFALLIEDKVDAPLQPEQVKRYRMRADRGILQEFWADYEVVLCAPVHYIQGMPGLGEFDHLMRLMHERPVRLNVVYKTGTRI